MKVDLQASRLSRLTIVGRDRGGRPVVLARTVFPGPVTVRVAGRVVHIPLGSDRVVCAASGDYEIVEQLAAGGPRWWERVLSTWWGLAAGAAATSGLTLAAVAVVRAAL